MNDRVAPIDDAHRRNSRRRLVDAASVAEYIGMERSFVYEHKAELGAMPMGTGRWPRLRFDLDVVGRWLAERRTCSTRRQSESPKRVTKRRHRASATLCPSCCPMRGSAPFAEWAA